MENLEVTVTSRFCYVGKRGNNTLTFQKKLLRQENLVGNSLGLAEIIKATNDPCIYSKPLSLGVVLDKTYLV